MRHRHRRRIPLADRERRARHRAGHPERAAAPRTNVVLPAPSSPSTSTTSPGRERRGQLRAERLGLGGAASVRWPASAQRLAARRPRPVAEPEREQRRPRRAAPAAGRSPVFGSGRPVCGARRGRRCAARRRGAGSGTGGVGDSGGGAARGCCPLRARRQRDGSEQRRRCSEAGHTCDGHCREARGRLESHGRRRLRYRHARHDDPRAETASGAIARCDSGMSRSSKPAQLRDRQGGRARRAR